MLSTVVSPRYTEDRPLVFGKRGTGKPRKARVTAAGHGLRIGQETWVAGTQVTAAEKAGYVEVLDRAPKDD